VDSWYCRGPRVPLAHGNLPCRSPIATTSCSARDNYSVALQQADSPVSSAKRAGLNRQLARRQSSEHLTCDALVQGSGKTLAFAIPIVQSLLHERAGLLRDSAADGGRDAAFDFGDPQNAASMAALTRSDSGPLRALVLCPTRELALQVRHRGLVSTIRA